MVGALSLPSMARRFLPVPWRRFLRRAAIETPQRLLDLPKDLLCIVFPRAFGGPLPPPSLRSRVGQISRHLFTHVGEEGCRQIVAAFERVRAPGRAYPVWLDFGCGCGRLARHVAEASPVRELYGVDVDAALIAFARDHLRGQFMTMWPAPPLAFEPSSFDVVYATSVFTHYDENDQLAWIKELRRILKPGGLLIATTLSPWLAGTFRGLVDADFRQLTQRGFLTVNRDGRFNERATFESGEYLAETWGRELMPRLWEPFGFVGYQDLSIWEKPTST